MYMSFETERNRLLAMNSKKWMKSDKENLKAVSKKIHREAQPK